MEQRLFTLVEAESALQTLIADDAAAGGDDDIVKDLGLDDLRRIALMGRPKGQCWITNSDGEYRLLMVDELSYEKRMGVDHCGDLRPPIRRAAWDQSAEEWARIESALEDWNQAKA